MDAIQEHKFDGGAGGLFVFLSELRNMVTLPMNVERHSSCVGSPCWSLPGNA